MENEHNQMFKKLFEVKKAGIILQRDTKAYNYKYATLDQIQKKLGNILEEQRLVVFHQINLNVVRTEIRDLDSDGFVASEIEMSHDIKPQDKGSEITYYRRYNLLSLLDLEVEDDDGKQAQDSKPKEVENDLPWIADENIDNIAKLIKEGQTFSIQDVRKKYKVSRANATRLEALGVN